MKKLQVFNLLFACLVAVSAVAQDSTRVSESKKTKHAEDTAQFSIFTIREKMVELDGSRLKPVENTSIYEGKKSEVIHTENLIANVASNNARQVFNRVAGLNIWENDGAGLQLSIGGRGLDPNRSSNFNVRQNGYDISADALGYPESYYTPPIEAVDKIQVVRGAGSLQYGTQFGGYINFEMKKPVSDRKFEILFRQSVGSFGFYNAFNSISGTHEKISYYSFFQYKRMDGWRENSQLQSYTGFANINYKISEKSRLGLDYTSMTYLAQQAGGLTDQMFEVNPRLSNRERNWFNVGWNLLAIHFNHQFNKSSELNLRMFGLLANRNAIGFRPNRVATEDIGSERDLLKGNYKNYGSEIRYLKRTHVLKCPVVFLSGVRFYKGYNKSVQGLGSTGKDADFKFINTDQGISNDYIFPNTNVSLFTENIIQLSRKFSITPGVRIEYIQTKAEGYYQTIMFDLAGNIISTSRTNEKRISERQIVLGGIGLSYKPRRNMEIYGNITQNYRSITFNDMRITNPSQVIDPNLKDEKGYSLDLGFRNNNRKYTIDISGFVLNYRNRIGEIQSIDAGNRVIRLRTNIGQALLSGLEAYLESNLLNLKRGNNKKSEAVIFANLAMIHSEYLSGKYSGISGNRVEFVPELNVKSGFRLVHKKFKFSFQATYLSAQYTDATNAIDGGVSAVNGLIPAYYVLDASASYQIKRFKIELSSNNLSNNLYFTRRASGYPGPGILPSDGRSLFLTVACKI